jgi:hypothetical protein
MVSHAILRRSFAHALGTVAYVALVGTIMSNGDKLFGDKPDSTVLGPISFLLLFVVSASVTGLLVLGTPARWYLDGRKSEAVQLLGTTVGWLAIFAILGLLLLMVR